MTLTQAAAIAATLSTGAAAWSQTAHFKPLPTGATKQIGGYMPIRLQLGPTEPTDLKKAPKLAAPLYGHLSIGGKSVLVALDAPAGQPQKLYVDTNGNGNLTDDPPTQWTAEQRGQYQFWSGGALVDLGKMRAHLGMYRFDPNDPQRAALKSVLLYFSDYAMEGEIHLGGKTFHAMLADMGATGDFRGDANAALADPPKASGAWLMIDVNGNGRFDRRGEQYDVRKPFNIGGVTYEIANLDAGGSKFDIVKSAKTVAEILPPPDLSKGKKMIAFNATDMDGGAITFPSTFKGKIVMLDFWATWCGPCMGEVPNVVKAYQAYHDKGFEILGISLDQANAVDKIKTVTKDNSMTWRQVYDGKFWQAEIARLYAIDSIPAAFLVDGDTGEVLASGNELRGDSIMTVVRLALEKKKLL